MVKEKNWSGVANDFDARQNYIVGQGSIKIIEKELAKLDKLKDLLELGCGNGKYTCLLAKAADNIIATDLSEEMLGVAKAKLKDFTNVIVEQADCYKTRYDDEKFDTVFMANLIHVIMEPEKSILEARRILKSSGRLIILSYTTDGMTAENIDIMKRRYLEVFGSFPSQKTPMELLDLIKLVEENNFAVESSLLIGDKTKAMYLIARK